MHFLFEQVSHEVVLNFNLYKKLRKNVLESRINMSMKYYLILLLHPNLSVVFFRTSNFNYKRSHEGFFK